MLFQFIEMLSVAEVNGVVLDSGASRVQAGKIKAWTQQSVMWLVVVGAGLRVRGCIGYSPAAHVLDLFQENLEIEMFIKNPDF